MALEVVFQFVEAKEAGKRSAGRLSDTLGANAARSQYRRGKQEELKQRKTANNNEPCTYLRPPRSRQECRPQGQENCLPRVRRVM